MRNHSESTLQSKIGQINTPPLKIHAIGVP
jgi:hypothetical protein